MPDLSQGEIIEMGVELTVSHPGLITVESNTSASWFSSHRSPRQPFVTFRHAYQVIETPQSSPAMCWCVSQHQGCSGLGVIGEASAIIEGILPRAERGFTFRYKGVSNGRSDS